MIVIHQCWFLSHGVRVLCRSVMSDSLRPHGAHQALLSMEFSRQEYWSGLPFPPSGYLPDPGINPSSPVSLALQADSVPLSHQRSPSNLSHNAFPRYRDAFQIHSACVSVGHGEFKTPKPQSPVRNWENRWDESEGLLALPEGAPFTEPWPPRCLPLLPHQL